MLVVGFQLYAVAVVTCGKFKKQQTRLYYFSFVQKQEVINKLVLVSV